MCQDCFEHLQIWHNFSVAHETQVWLWSKPFKYSGSLFCFYVTIHLPALGSGRFSWFEKKINHPIDTVQRLHLPACFEQRLLEDSGWTARRWMVSFLSYCMDCCSTGCLLHVLRHCWGASLREEDIQRETTASDWLLNLKGPPIRHHPQYVTVCVCFPLWFWMHRVSLHIFSRLQFCMHAWSYVCLKSGAFEAGEEQKIEMLMKKLMKK